MICQNCSAAIPEDQLFCGKCGYKASAETLGSIGARLGRVEEQLANDSRTKTTHQNYLELETTEKVMSRVKSWTTLILYFAGIPAAIALLALTVMFGKGAFDLHTIAASAQYSVTALLNRAKSEASEADATAKSALNTSTQVNAEIQETRRRVTELHTQVDARSSEVQKLVDQVKTSQDQVQALRNTVSSQTVEIQRLTDQVTAVRTAKGVADVQNAYPIFGEHVARNQFGWIDPKQKAPGTTYVDLNLFLTASLKLNDEKVADAVTALNDHKYNVTLGRIYTYARSAANAQAIGMGFDENSCMYWPAPMSQPPCILYFREDLKTSAMKVRELVQVAQTVPEERVLYVNPAKLDPQKRELLNLSAIDIVVVLGQE